MSNTYQRQAETALKLIEKKGQTMTLYRLGLGTYNPVTPESNVPAVVDQCQAKGIVLPGSQNNDDRMALTLEQRQYFRSVILAGLNLAIRPQVEDLLKTGEGLYRFLSITPLDPAGQGPIIFNASCTLDVSLDPDALVEPGVIYDSETGLPISDSETGIPLADQVDTNEGEIYDSETGKVLGDSSTGQPISDAVTPDTDVISDSETESELADSETNQTIAP